MKYIEKAAWYTLFIFALLIGGAVICVLLPSSHNVHRATHIILWVDETPTLATLLGVEPKDKKPDKKICGATAIGPYALLTAEHCMGTGDKISIDGEENVVVAGTLSDGSDHMLIFTKKYWFADWVKVAERPLEQGEHFTMYGNPHEHQDLYREGYVMGRENLEGTGNQVVLELNGFYGDSGSGLFNSSGEVTTVLSRIWIIALPQDDPRYLMKTMGAYDLHFRKSDLDYAQIYHP